MSAPSPGRVAPYIDPDEVLAVVIPLFARVPSLAKKLMDNAGGDIADDKAHSFFNDLFVGTSRPAVGANYNIVGYRLRDVDELHAMCGAAEGNLMDFDGHVAFPALEITPEMIEAGLSAYAGHNEDFEDRGDIISRVYAAMISRSKFVAR